MRFTQASVRFTQANLGQVHQLKRYGIHDRVFSSPLGSLVRQPCVVTRDIGVAPMPPLSPGEDLAAAAGATLPLLAWQNVDHRRGCGGDASVNTTATKMTVATVTTATADAIWCSRSRSPPDVPRLEGIGKRYTPNHLKQPPPPFFRRDKTDH